MLRYLLNVIVAIVLALPLYANALALGAGEFKASRLMACVMAQEALGQLSEEEYGEHALSILDDFEESERDNIIAKALGYYDGLMFAVAEGDRRAHDLRLRDFLASGSCGGDQRRATVSL